MLDAVMLTMEFAAARGLANRIRFSERRLVVDGFGSRSTYSDCGADRG